MRRPGRSPRGRRWTERDPVEEPQGRYGLVERGPGDPVLGQMDLIGSHILDAEVGRRASIVPAERLDRGDVRGLGRGRQIADRHVLDHAPAQLGDTLTHGVLLSEGVGFASTTFADRTPRLPHAPSALAVQFNHIRPYLGITRDSIPGEQALTIGNGDGSPRTRNRWGS